MTTPVRQKIFYENPRNPIAQSFYVDEPEGIFITKVNLYFQKTSSISTVTLQLRPMDNGFPSNSQIIPGSTVYINGNTISTDSLARNATTFTFEEPIYLQGRTSYAICCITPHPDFEIWVAQIDEFEVGTTARRVARNPTLGSLFYSHNGGTWTADQRQDLKFDLHRCEFDTSKAGVIRLNNAPVRRELLTPDPMKTDSGSNIVRVIQPSHGFVANDTVLIEGIDSSTNVGGIAATSILGPRTVANVNYTGYTITAGASATSNDKGGGTGVFASRNIGYSLAYDHTQVLIPMFSDFVSSIKRTTGKSYAGSETAYQLDDTFKSSVLKNNMSFTEPYVVANNTIETAELGANIKSLQSEHRIRTSSSLVAPMVDLQRSSMTLVDNLIDAQDSANTSGFNAPFEFISETAPFGGTSAAKHVTTPITLDEDAVGIKIIFAANRPKACQIEVYFRRCTLDENILEATYEEIPEESNNPPDDKLIYRDYRYLAGGEGGSLPAFSKFQIKIVMKSTNKALVPIIKDLRVIALSV